MKNYALNEKEEYNFILNYKKEKDKVIIKYANGDQFVMPYSIELEKKLLQQMRNQVVNAEKAKIQINNKKKTIKSRMIIAEVLFALIGVGGIIITNSMLALIIGCGVEVLVAIVGDVSLEKKNSILRDIEKTQTFIEKENLFQTKVYDGMGMFKNTNKDTKKFVKEISSINDKRNSNSESDIEKLNLNYVDQMSYDTFFDIVDLIDKNEQFEDVISRPKAKTLSKPKTIDIRID